MSLSLAAVAVASLITLGSRSTSSDDAKAAEADIVAPTMQELTDRPVADEVRSGETGTSSSVANRSTGQVVAVSGANGLSGIVSAELGYLGLGPIEPAAVPNILRSVDGLEWTLVETTLTDLRADVERTRYQFSNLLRTPTGFSVVAVPLETQDTSSAQDTASTANVVRLSSEDGVTWARDPLFPEIDVEMGGSYVLSSTADMFAIADPVGFTNPAIDRLAETWFPDAKANGSCGAELRFGTTLVFYPCGLGLPIQVSRQDLVERDRFEEIAACAERLSYGDLIESRLLIALRGQSEPQIVANVGLSATQPVVTNDGDVIMIGAGGPSGVVADSCDGFMEVDDPKGPALEIHSGEGVRRVDLPTDVPVEAFFSVRGQPLVNERTVLLITFDTVWAVDLDSGVWRRESDDLLLGGDWSVALSRDGQTLVHIAPWTVVSIDLASGDRRSYEYFDLIDAPQIVYVDDEFVFIQGVRGMFRATRPTAVRAQN